MIYKLDSILDAHILALINVQYFLVSSQTKHSYLYSTHPYSQLRSKKKPLNTMKYSLSRRLSHL